MKRLVPDGPPLPYKRRGVILKPEVMSLGYLRVDMQIRRQMVHTLVLLAFTGPPRKDQVGRHLNGCAMG